MTNSHFVYELLVVVQFEIQAQKFGRQVALEGVK